MLAKFQHSWLSLALLLATVLLALALAQQSSLAHYWQVAAAYDALYWFAATATLALLLRIGLGQRAALALLTLMLGHFGLLLGLAQVGTVALWFATSLLVGQALLGLLVIHPAQRSLFTAFWLGQACLITCFSVLLHWPLNTRLFYLLLFSVPWLVLLLTRQMAVLSSWHLAFQRGMQATLAIPYWSLAALLIGIGYVLRHALLPSIGFDDNTLHLRLWTELLTQHRAVFDVQTQVWSVAPFAVDLQHALLSVLAGDDIRSTLNISWALLIIGLLWQQLQQWQLTPFQRSLLLLLFASTPMFGYLTTTLQTELFLAVLVMSALHFLLRTLPTALASSLIGLLALAALAIASKLPGLVLAALFVSGYVLQLFLLKQHQQFSPKLSLQTTSTLRQILTLLSWVGLLLGLAVLALLSYWNAWRLTGNPVFPLYNQIFQSPFFDSSSNFTDLRWVHGFSLISYWQLFFNTAQFHEGQNFSAGFQYLLLLPLALCIAWRRQRNQAVMPILVMLGFGIAMFANTQYWRYLFPVLPIASLLLAALFHTPLHTRSALQPWIATGALSFCLALNAAYYQGIVWYYYWPLYHSYTQAGKKIVQQQAAPILSLNEYLNTYAAGAKVLYPTEEPFGATLKGEPVYAAWFAPAFGKKVQAITAQTDVLRTLRDEQLDYVIWNIEAPLALDSTLWWLAQTLNDYGVPERQEGRYILYRLVDSPLSWQPLASTGSLLAASTEMQLHSSYILKRTQMLRYQIDYTCIDASGQLILQFKWNLGSAWQRSLPCSASMLQFQESFPVPLAATQVDVYVQSTLASGGTVNAIKMEID